MDSSLTVLPSRNMQDLLQEEGRHFHWRGRRDVLKVLELGTKPACLVRVFDEENTDGQVELQAFREIVEFQEEKEKVFNGCCLRTEDIDHMRGLAFRKQESA